MRQSSDGLPLVYTDCAGEQSTLRKRYRTVGLVMFCVFAGLLVVRLISYYLPVTNELLSDVIFTVPLQIGVLVVLPFLIYRKVLKMNTRQILAFSNVRRTKWYNLALALPIGLCVYCATLAVSGMWQAFISALGYTHSSVDTLPDRFNAGVLILNIMLTGVLPGICEEFCNRGGFLTTMRGSFPFGATILIAGLEFGLFHQNITQVFYTVFFGMFAAFLTLKCGSVFPAMIMHFTNNTFSVFNEFCGKYGWLGGGLNAAINAGAAKFPFVIVLCFALILLIGLGLVALMLRLNAPRRVPRPASLLPPASDIFVEASESGETTGAPAAVPSVPARVAARPKENLFKPTLLDNAFYIGAIVMAAATTVFTFIFGAIV